MLITEINKPPVTKSLFTILFYFILLCFEIHVFFLSFIYYKMVKQLCITICHVIILYMLFLFYSVCRKGNISSCMCTSNDDAVVGPLGLDYFNDLYCKHSGFTAFLVIVFIVSWCVLLIYLCK